MWRDTTRDEKVRLVEVALEFTSDHARYGAAMLEVLAAYPTACEHNLTDTSMNRQAWIGHAACYLKTESPEYITREAWSLLTDQQRIDANNEAAKAIAIWERAHEAKNYGMDQKVGRQGVFEWDS